MSDSPGFALAITLGEILSIAIALYAAYWAFAIRKALTGRIYRNHALSLGVVCVIFAFVNFLPSGGSTIVLVATNIFFGASVSVVFAFLDSTVRVARRSDPLLRSVLHWEKLRLVVWGDIGLIIIASALLVVDPSILTSSFSGFYQNDPSAQSSGLSVLLGIVSILFPLAVGTPALLIGARRSRDPVLRGSLKWIGIVLLLLLAEALVGFLTSNSTLTSTAFVILISYALYKSARSLAPINRLPAVESETTDAPGTVAPSPPAKPT